ncbi:hypothetical protein [Rhodococcus spongiicola]|uniref:Uncharacterized protein n=1 Tax=Rhodococcus spongiicola TaxID=2487352 RepID=A0A3S3AC82_9NOCA|nr:hypothetical protein [Rhodococcus spongiicola]RVW04643.1 hypothetical protein EF834_06270 [Rhodococcus spongiicola]
MDADDVDFAHTDQASRRRREKALALARFAWDRGITGAELLELPDDRLRKLARAAGTNPPSTHETWTVAAELIDEKDRWAAAHHGDPRAVRPHTDEKIMWVKPPIAPWS